MGKVIDLALARAKRTALRALERDTAAQPAEQAPRLPVSLWDRLHSPARYPGGIDDMEF